MLFVVCVKQYALFLYVSQCWGCRLFSIVQLHGWDVTCELWCKYMYWLVTACVYVGWIHSESVDGNRQIHLDRWKVIGHVIYWTLAEWSVTISKCEHCKECQSNHKDLTSSVTDHVLLVHSLHMDDHRHVLTSAHFSCKYGHTFTQKWPDFLHISDFAHHIFNWLFLMLFCYFNGFCAV